MNFKTIRVLLAHRAAGKFHSIEGLFRSIGECYPEWVSVASATAPASRANPNAIWANLRWFRSFKGYSLAHLTGDIHYAILGTWRTPVVLTIHDLRFFEESTGLTRLLFWLGWLFLPCLRANRVTVISEFTKERLLKYCPVSPTKLRVIPNCVSEDFVATEKSWNAHRPCILLVGTTANKNLDRIAEACQGLHVRLAVLGVLDNRQRAALNARALEYEIHSNLPKEEVVELYQSCDLVCFVSTYEGFGMPILEGQAVGRPVMASDISPMREVAGEGALKVNPLNVKSIREGLVRLLQDASLRQTLVANGFKNVAKYSATAIAAQYAGLYREVLDESSI